jgi:hypothetical protein
MTLAFPSVGQEKRVDDRGYVIGSEEHIAANKRMHDLMLNPTFSTLRLAVSNPDKVPQSEGSYQQGDRIRFDLFLTHSLTEPIEVLEGDPYGDLRPELFRDGEPFPYLKRVQEIAERRQKKPETIAEVPSRLMAGKEYLIGTVDANEWYGVLPQGHYQFSVSRRFVYGGKWIQSDSLTFEVN